MSTIISIKDYKRNKGKDVGLENRQSKFWIHKLKINKYYKESFVTRFIKYIDNPKDVSKYDVLLLLKGISENKELPAETKKTLNCVFQLEEVNNILDNEMSRKTSMVHKSRKSFIFRQGTLQYFQALLEMPHKITGYDVYMIISCLRDTSDIERVFFRNMTGAIYQLGVNPKNKEVYEESLLSQFLAQPRLR
ncbi:hypothetical protein NZZ89_002487 [Staphylococcus pseudintermedius]|uniref:hypothetical protein n=1 Tax=Staphylococcus pseudintermedius TaxID=283734 RepID=UPI000BBC6682|nr:hypothetical protein [Staphylococcus pseudintermedius]EGQ2789525.1 hypothetical protein [Staphylococcus pseudintermedius]EGQ3068756.1 hypothetical protein [Staphylococcus pseudintermedius]EII2716941.1 hypothetical protein [Staphylococcus pseudintermedius]EJM2441460.1 hypothetical protein [Staphylococcus pseudintermedius]EJQ7844710.1 hypothetical protein [Staphylococcus pseudintermedius]